MGDCDCDCDWRILTTVINSFYHIIKQHEAKVQKANIIIYSTVPTEYDPFSHSIFRFDFHFLFGFSLNCHSFLHTVWVTKWVNVCWLRNVFIWPPTWKFNSAQLICIWMNCSTVNRLTINPNNGNSLWWFFTEK